MSLLSIAAILLCLAGLFAWVNQRYFRLPATIGLMLLALLNALALLMAKQFAPAWVAPAERMMTSIDFDRTLMQGMLGYLLFAGALHVDLAKLRNHRTIVLLLATAGVLITAVLVGGATWLVTQVLDLDVPFIYCLAFGALIAPTDPIAVLAILKQVGAPKSIEVKLAGESLFNDGVAVVVFIGLLRIAGIGGPTASSPTEDDLTSEIVHHATSMGELFLVEVGGGVLLGLGLGYLLVALLGSIDDYKTEVLLTLAGVTGGYVLCTYLHFSGPLAMVIAGLFIGHRGRRSALSDESVRRLDEFWELIDEILNAVLFVLVGLEVLVITLKPSFLVAGFAVVPLALLGRFVTVAGMAALLKTTQEFTPGATRLLAWAGLRGGVSVALALSLKGKLPPDLSGVGDLLVTMTYVVVCFSIIVQGLTIGLLVKKLGLATGAARMSHAP
ncbi:MAG: sodium:proton antiporter [Myxococcales bacterium]|nr:sodium:proton antiporter [Myxococcales bacterium]